MPPEFLAQNTQELTMRAQSSLNTLNSSNLIPIRGSRLSKFAGSNMNALWATIVLGEWCANFEDAFNGLDGTFQLVRDGIDAAQSVGLLASLLIGLNCWTIEQKN